MDNLTLSLDQTHLAKQVAQLNSESDLRSLATTLAATIVYDTLKLAHIVKRATELDFDVTDWGIGLNPSRREALINIAKGVMGVEVYTALGHKNTLLRPLATLPVDEQLRLANGGSFEVVQNGDGDVRLVTADKINAQEMKQVFNETGGLRSKLGQLVWLGNQRKASHATEPEASEVKIGKGFVEITGPMQLTVAQLLELVSRLTSRK